MRVLCIGDQHFQVANIEVIDCFLRELQFLLQREKFDFIVSLGDLLHTHERLHTIALNKANEYIKLLSSFAKTYILVGNHDYINHEQFMTSNHWLNPYKEWDNVVVADTLIIEQIGNHFFTFLPYVPPGRLFDALYTGGNRWKSSSCIFLHQDINTAKMNQFTKVENANDWGESFPFVCSGHIHIKQRVNDNWIYAGSAMQTNFGETEDKSILSLTFPQSMKTSSERRPKIEEIFLQVPKRVTIRCDLAELKEMGSSKFHNLDKYRIILTATQLEYKNFAKSSAYKKLDNLPNLKILLEDSTICPRKEEEVTIRHSIHFIELLTKNIRKESSKVYDLFIKLL